MLTRRARRFRSRGLGQEKVEEPAKAAAKGAATGSVLGPVGTAIGAILGAGVKIMQGMGLAKKARAGRLAAQDQLVKWQLAAKTFKDGTVAFRGMKVPDAAYKDFTKMAIDINNNAHAAAAQYRAEAGF